ncbi:type III-A CRISPR-associated protein Cas10/Csm1 [Caviibacterium pharyngocola]|uniref:CRISPR system single-strand-specific deoxyribonuclease Cas10/Csm1 (subtype III-A) n=1 Tax=Caviibacterium pharyngocola TaxID=28159 RepID=A0A2M8RU50_9PAST|nr:type III-A CRISPR-associated protein Cas10/Csm1 [Caviibacterium pharyngocola]PJG82420.1 type III-A CRISPR-associated protein Cas10/Csm1 [Caviibacterium pharyngocola]
MNQLLSSSSQIAFAALVHSLKTFATQHNLPFSPENFTLYQKPDHQLLSIFTEAEKIASNINGQVEHASDKLRTLLEQITLSKNKSAKPRFGYPIQPMSAESIFPTELNRLNISSEKIKEHWERFNQALKDIPSSHQGDLWLDHFDTAFQCFGTCLPSQTADISLYDHSKAVAALATALWRNEQESNTPTSEKFLLIQGDFFGIQDFIFSGGRETNKQAAKLLRGRSFQVSLFAELAALKVLQACELPTTSQIINAAGKFLIVAPNTTKIKQAIERVQTELDQWFIKKTYGLIGLGIATQTATAQDFTAMEFRKLQKSLFEALEVKKLQRLDLTASTASVQDIEYSNGVCELNGNFPAEQDGCSVISRDQIKIGDLLAKKDRIIIAEYNAKIYEDYRTKSLELNIFGFSIVFTDEQESSGDFSKLSRAEQIYRFWDFSIPQKLTEQIWKGYARRYINAYIPYFKETDRYDEGKYSQFDLSERIVEQPKTFDYLACEDRFQNANGSWIGQKALMTLKGDVDNLGTIFQKGLEKPNFAKMAALSRQMNQFFSLWLPAYCAEHYPNMYTVFAGGDDFFLIGPWHTTQKIANAMRQHFADYVARNPDIHFSVGMVMTKVGVPVPHLGEMAEEALEQAKAVDGKNAVTIYKRAVSWNKWHLLTDLEDEINRLAENYDISTGYFYSLIRFAKQAEDKENLESTMWRSRFAYRTSRYVTDKLAKEKRPKALNELIISLGDKGIEQHKGNFIIPLFNYFYSKR